MYVILLYVDERSHSRACESVVIHYRCIIYGESLTKNSKILTVRAFSIVLFLLFQQSFFFNIKAHIMFLLYPIIYILFYYPNQLICEQITVLKKLIVVLFILIVIMPKTLFTFCQLFLFRFQTNFLILDIVKCDNFDLKRHLRVG